MLNRVLTNADEYLKKLKFRVKDNTLKVLITGDLNSGKSTLINAIFHQNILPTDQQPCTQSFCEVIPSIESLIQPKIIGYKLVSFNSADDGDELSHEQMKEELQNENSSYKWFKISVPISKYITDSSNQMCVSFIDSPGLNTDLFKTTSLLNQQQDIDVVVFVVNASFHLTLSGKEFLEKAAKEKEKIFFVVNKFDEIENFKKCKKLITNQIRQILPETFVDAQNLIHFVSAKRSLLQSIEIDAETVPANEIITNNDDKVTSKETSKFNDDFENMKSSLINFLFTKRSISKLAPAKTFSTRLLQDLYELSSLNLKYFKSESQLTESKLEKARKNVQKQEKDELELKTGLNRIILSSSEACFKNTLSQTVSFSDSVAKILNSPKYPGIWNIRSNLTEKYKRIAQYYSQTMVKIETEALEIKTNGQNEIDSFSDKYEIEIHKRSISLEASKFELIMPLRKPELFDLFDPREIINSFGTLNLTSLVGVFAGIQPCTNLIWKFSQRVGINPLIISALIFGGFGKGTIWTIFFILFRNFYLICYIFIHRKGSLCEISKLFRFTL